MSFHEAAVTVGGRVIWSDVNLNVGQGEFVAILGPNGAGKSTLIKAALGLHPADGRQRADPRPGTRRRQPPDRLPPPAPQLRREPAHARGRHRAARLGRRALGFPLAAEAKCAAGGGGPGTPNSSSSSARRPTRTARSASSPAGSSSGCSSPRRSPTARHCCCSTSRSTAWICRRRPRSPRCSVTSAGAKTSP